MSSKHPHARDVRKGRHSQPGLHYFLTTSIAGRRPIFTVREHALIFDGRNLYDPAELRGLGFEYFGIGR